jgi:hypothetical protein
MVCQSYAAIPEIRIYLKGFVLNHILTVFKYEIE